MKISIALSIIAVASTACGGTSREAASPPEPASPAAPAGAALLTGDFVIEGEATRVTWLRPGGAADAIYGVAGSVVPVVWVVDDVDGALRLWRYTASVVRVCDETREDGGALVFSCEDGVGGIRFRRRGDALEIEDWTSSDGPHTLRLTPAPGAPAPALEDAERAFDADSAARGAKAWVAAFAPDGVVWRGTDEHRGSTAIETAITQTLRAIDLRWQPTLSRTLVPDQLGVTTGTWTGTPRGGGATAHGTYFTLWRKDPAGWRITLDVGRRT